MLSRQAFRRFRRRVDYSEYGGAPLVGLNGLCIVGHGRSSAKAVANAVTMAVRAVNEDLLGRLSRDVAASPHARDADPTRLAPRTSRMIAFVFPGQGAQKVGMGRSLAEAFPVCRDTFAEADAALGEPLSALCFDGPGRSADADREHAAGDPRDEHGGGAAGGVARHRGRAFAAGHSLGEYSAHVAAGTLSFADALRTVKRRGRYMQEAVPVGEGAMAAILGLDADGVARACAEAADGRGRDARRTSTRPDRS